MDKLYETDLFDGDYRYEQTQTAGNLVDTAGNRRGQAEYIDNLVNSDYNRYGQAV